MIRRRLAIARISTALAVLQLLLGTSVTGCKRDEGSVPRAVIPSADSVFYFIGPSEFDPRWPAIRGGARRQAAKLPPMDIRYVAPRGDDPALRAALVQECINQNAIGACLFVNDHAVGEENAADSARAESRDDPYEKLAADLRSASVLVVTIGRRLSSGVEFGHVDVGAADGAEQLGERLEFVAPGKQSYVLLNERGRGPLGDLNYTRFSNAVRRTHAFTLLDERDVYASATPARRHIRDMLAKFSHAGLVVTLAPDPWLALQPRLALDGSTQFATLGASPALWPRLQSGEAAALVGPLDGEIGYQALRLAWEGLVSARPSGSVVMIDSEVVTPDRLEAFAKRYADAAGLDLKTLMP